jgi:uncharacterized membrane protein
MIGCMICSVEMIVYTIKENRTSEIIAREFSEWKVSIHGILRDVVEDARNKEPWIHVERLD